jgi:hypothetical protein
MKMTNENQTATSNMGEYAEEAINYFQKLRSLCGDAYNSIYIFNHEMQQNSFENRKSLCSKMLSKGYELSALIAGYQDGFGEIAGEALDYVAGLNLDKEDKHYDYSEYLRGPRGLEDLIKSIRTAKTEPNPESLLKIVDGSDNFKLIVRTIVRFKMEKFGKRGATLAR